MDIKQLKADLRRDEGVRLKPYRDTEGKLTIGCGRNLDDVGISVVEADMLLEADVAIVTLALDKYLPWWRLLSEGRQRALTNMCFNLGIHGLLKFKNMLNALDQGNWQEAAKEAMASKWAEQVGARAKRISDLFLKG